MPAEQKLTFNGKPLDEDGKTLKDCQIGKKSTLQCIRERVVNEPMTESLAEVTPKSLEMPISTPQISRITPIEADINPKEFHEQENG